jgi:hypothetical protein
MVVAPRDWKRCMRCLAESSITATGAIGSNNMASIQPQALECLNRSIGKEHSRNCLINSAVRGVDEARDGGGLVATIP